MNHIMSILPIKGKKRVLITLLIAMLHSSSNIVFGSESNDMESQAIKKANLDDCKQGFQIVLQQALTTNENIDLWHLDEVQINNWKKKDSTTYPGDDNIDKFVYILFHDNAKSYLDNDTDNNGNTLLGQAVLKNNESFLKFLLQAGLVDIDQPNNMGVNPLMIACKEGRDRLVQHLVDAGADVNYSSFNLGTPLIMAVVGGNHTIVQQLLDAGADVNCSDKFGCTPLWLACIEGHDFIVRQLLAAHPKARVNESNFAGVYPLMVACQEGHVTIVEQLLDAGANVDCHDNKHGYTPLMIAAEEGHDMVVEVLLAYGADKTVVNHFGESALALAKTPAIRKQISAA